MTDITTKAEALKKVYGRFGKPYDPTRCVQSVSEEGLRFPSFNQCSRKPGFGPDGLYCKQHDPAAWQKRRDDSYKKYKDKLRAERPKWYGHAMLALLKESQAAITDEWKAKRDKLIKEIEA